MRILIAAMFITISLATPSFAQVADRSIGTRTFTDLCIRQAGPNVTTPEPTCACGAGVISGRMDDRQFGIMTRLSPHTGNQPAMSADIQRMMGEGYTAQEITTVGQMLVDLGPFISATCGVLER